MTAMPSTPRIRNSDERGIAMITTLLVLMLMSALLVGFTTVVMSDQRYRFIDRDRGQAFYAASAGVEKLTADIGNLFLEYVAPTAAQVQNLTATPPAISGITFTAAQAAAALPASQLTTYHCAAPVAGANTKVPFSVGGNGYTVTFCKSIATGNPTISDDNLVISGTGAYAGMTALQSPYQIDVTAKTATGGEVHLVRTMQSVAIPVFQFGIFSDSDLSFYAAETFNFGGRIHTNGNLFLAEGANQTLTTTGKITAVGDVVRQNLANGVGIAAIFQTGTVSLATSVLAPAGNRALQYTPTNEGSVAGMPGSAANANWPTISLGATPGNYNGFIKTTATGAKRLSLPLTATGVNGTNVDLIRRPPVGENTAGILFNERLYSKASLRILLSDTLNDINTLPGISAGNPVSLEAWTSSASYLATANATHPPLAVSAGPITMTAFNPAATATAGEIKMTLATKDNFKPTFTQSGSPAQVIICDAKAGATFTGCKQTPSNLAISAQANGSITQVGPAPGPTVAITSSNAATGVITFGSVAAADTFRPTAFWSSVTTQIYCTGWNAQVYSGCSSIPPNSAPLISGYMSNAGTSLLGGYIKVDRQNANGTWTDVTTEILNYGIGGQNFGSVALGSVICAEPTTNAIIRLQRLRENTGTCNNYATDATGAKDAANWWPNVLFDTRESALRDDPALTTMTLGGVMYYVNLDVGNLARYFAGAVAPYNAAGAGGAGSKTDNGGYTVYFSDRRNNRNAANAETGEFGWEDFVNPGVANGLPNTTLQTGEDVNGSLALDTYGGVPNFQGAAGVPGCTFGGFGCANGVNYGAAPTTGYVLKATAALTDTVNQRTAQMNRPIFFRRALKLTNGATIAPTITGLTVVSENPVYVHGNYNDTTGNAAAAHAATAIIADAVTILSPNWNDNNSFVRPFAYAAPGRQRSLNSYYRVAILAGKGINFPQPADVAGGPFPTSFGTDGGAHNFLRMLEQDGTNNGQGTAGTTTVNYRGSMATLAYNRQAVGTFKCCSGTFQDGIVYSVPNRAFFFDTDFLQPALLPPNTPMFRDLNVIGFSQELRPGK